MGVFNNLFQSKNQNHPVEPSNSVESNSWAGTTEHSFSAEPTDLAEHSFSAEPTDLAEHGFSTAPHSSVEQNISGGLSYTAKEANQKGFYFRINGQTCKIMTYKGSEKNIRIPAYINGKPVTQIRTRAFASKDIHSVILPDTLRVIWTEAFANNPIESITFPANISQVADGAFLNCKQLREVITKKAYDVEISHHAFKGTHYITAKRFVILGDMLLKINMSASSKDTFLEIPSGVREIKREAFYWSDYHIEEIGIPASTESIEDRAFASCHHLKDVLLEKGQGAFYFTVGKAAFGYFSKDGWRENPFLWNLRRRFIEGDPNRKSGWITFRNISISYSDYHHIDIYIPHSRADEFWKMVNVTFSYTAWLFRREFKLNINWSDFDRLFEQCTSLHDKIELATFVYMHLSYSRATKKEFSFLAAHIYKAIAYAVEDDRKQDLMLYKKMQLLSPERGFNPRKVRFLIEKYHNEAAMYLKEIID